MAKKKQGYWENLIKELGEFNSARSWANVEKGEYKTRNWGSNSADSKTSARLKGDANRAHKKEKAELGQLLGAAFQGRRYTKSGKQKKK